MSYRCGSYNRDINYFSNPDVSVMGLPTGVAGEANCARRIRDTMVRGRYLKIKAPAITQETSRGNISCVVKEISRLVVCAGQD